MYLSWIIPAYNEEKRIAKTVSEVGEYLSRHLDDATLENYEIIVVDSSSPDRTAEVVGALMPRIAKLKLLKVENKGKGWAVKQGMFKAEGDIRLFSDADNSTAPAYFDKMLPLFKQGFAIVISSRNPKDAPGAARDVKEPWYREVMGNLGNVLIQVFGVWGIWDTQNGFKAMRAKAAEDIFSRSRINGFAFDIEVLALAHRLGYNIAITPVRWVFAEDSKVTLKAYFQVFADVFRIRWNIITGKYDRE